MDKKNIYFIGVGGIGMSALARYFNQKGYQVAGYDRATNDLTKRLQAEGIVVTNLEEADAIPFPYRDRENTLVVYTPAIPAKHPMLSYFKEEEFECLKRAAVLGILSEKLKTIAVSGTHGKTTISTMIAFLLKRSGIYINAFLGGISRDFGTNLLIDEKAEWMVTEADEYDRSFLQLKPDLLIITSLDADHLDIYENQEELAETYSQLVGQMKENGLLLCKPSVKELLRPNHQVQMQTYQLDRGAEIRAEKVRVEDGAFIFNYVSDELVIENLKCGLPGKHNVENALAAIRFVLQLGLTEGQIKEGLAEFQGVKRRFDVHIKSDQVVYIDDYAHHPEEVKMLFESVRMLYPGKKITAIFQPHLFSRTRDFGPAFAEVLDLFDRVILLDIYPAREEPMAGIDSKWLAAQMKKKGVPICGKHQLINVLKSMDVEVLLTIGAGDIDTMIEPIITFYESRL